MALPGSERWHRDEFSVSHRSRNNLEQSDGEEGTAAGLGAGGGH